jgi:hypothetical protein
VLEECLPVRLALAKSELTRLNLLLLTDSAFVGPFGSWIVPLIP